MSSTGCRAILALAMLGCGGSEPKSAAAPAEPRPALADDAPEAAAEEPIQVAGTRGVLEMHEIQAGVKPHHAAFDACYQSRLKQLGFLHGALRFEVKVQPSGEVGEVRVIESDVGDWTVERCVLEEARGMRFARPKGGNREAVFSVPLDFTSSQGGVEVWPAERIAAVVSDKSAALAACKPVPGEVAVTLYVGNRGQVKAVGFSSADARPLDAWADCAAGQIAAWTFEDPRGKIVKSQFIHRPETP